MQMVEKRGGVAMQRLVFDAPLGMAETLRRFNEQERQTGRAVTMSETLRHLVLDGLNVRGVVPSAEQRDK